MINKKGKTHVTPNRTSSSTTTNKQADTLLRQIRTENAIKDLAKSNKKMRIVAPKSLSISSPSSTTTPTPTAAKSKKK
jgi:hypothetical protein